MGERRLTVRDRIIVHLAGYTRYADDFECPEEMSQVGISTSIGKSRAHTTLELNRMKSLDLITERLAHVKGAKSKRKTYVLSAEALAKEKEIVENIWSLEIEIRGSDKSEIVNGQQAVNILMKELTMPKVMAFENVFSSKGQINLDDIKSEHISTDRAAEPENETLDALILQANMHSKKGDLSKALAVLEKEIKTEISNRDRARLHYTRASIFRKYGKSQSALDEIDKSLEHGNESQLIARVNMEKAMILSDIGEVGQIMELLDSAEMVFRQINSQVDLMRCGINQGKILRTMGHINEAKDVLENTVEHAGNACAERQEAYALVNLTDLLNELKEYERSKELATRAKNIFQVLDEPLMLAASQFNLGEAMAALGEKAEAMKNLDKAIAILEKNEISRPGWFQHYAMILKELDDPEKAEKILAKINQ